MEGRISSAAGMIMQLEKPFFQKTVCSINTKHFNKYKYIDIYISIYNPFS